MAKISLAVKYRPETFDDMTEQSAIKNILENQINTRTFQHGYLFTGPAGTGKTTSARIFANMINDGRGNPIEIDAASNSGVENIRQVIDDAKRKPLDAEYKIFIIDECHSLSNGAWQALLKTLEEPPKFTIFILCTTDPQKIPNTILSRVQRYNFQKISNSGIENRLLKICQEENINTYGECLAYIAKIANGGMRDAITLLDKCSSLCDALTLENVLNVIGTEDYSVFFNFLNYLINKDEECISIIDKAYAEGKDVKQLMKEFSKFLLDVQRYIIYKDFKFVSIPETEDNKAKMDYLYMNNMSIMGIIKLVVDINNQIKWDSDPKTLIDLHLLIYCNEEEKYDRTAE